MKNILLFTLLTCFTIAIHAQKSQSITPPDTVLASFNEAFPGIEKKRWSKAKKGFYMVLFKNAEGLKTIAYYAPNGKWLQTKRYLYELPLNVEDAVYELYEYAELKKMVETEKPTSKQYLIILDSGKVLAKLIMDQEGKVVKKQEKPKGQKPKQ